VRVQLTLYAVANPSDALPKVRADFHLPQGLPKLLQFPTHLVLCNSAQHLNLTTMADPTQPTITHATTDDVPEILSMIKELAEYQEALDKVEATEESLRRTLCFASGGTQHSNPGYAKTLILRLPVKPANPNDQPQGVAGMAMYFNNYSTWRSTPGIYLEDLVVRSQYRKRGYGKMLIQALAQEVVRINGTRLEWSCLKWNQPSLDFYASLGAKQKNGLGQFAGGWTRTGRSRVWEDEGVAEWGGVRERDL